MASPLERSHIQIQQLQASTSSSSLYSTILFLLFLFFASLTLIAFQNSTTQSENFRRLIAADAGLTTKMAVDPYAFLHITRNPDGSITRLRHEPTAAANNGTDPSAAVWSRDIPLNLEKQTWIRLFLPRINATTTNTSATLNKLPIVVYLHGGGFVFLSADDARFHGFCERMAVELGVLVASVNYRLAPEHRLPAAYEDAEEALDLIIGKYSDPWLVEHGDRSRCVLMGESAGGNIAYQAGLQKAAEIKGVVLVQPYFGGVQRTASEERSVDDVVLPLSTNDLMWELSLPVGSDRDHDYCNPTIGGGSDLVFKWRELGLRVILTACGGDPLFDREMELAKMLEKRGVGLESKVWDGYYHGVFLTDPVLGKELFGIMRNNVLSST